MSLVTGKCLLAETPAAVYNTHLTTAAVAKPQLQQRQAANKELMLSTDKIKFRAIVFNACSCKLQSFLGSLI
jgi:hypothetical protein